MGAADDEKPLTMLEANARAAEAWWDLVAEVGRTFRFRAMEDVGRVRALRAAVSAERLRRYAKGEDVR